MGIESLPSGGVTWLKILLINPDIFKLCKGRRRMNIVRELKEQIADFALRDNGFLIRIDRDTTYHNQFALNQSRSKGWINQLFVVIDLLESNYDCGNDGNSLRTSEKWTVRARLICLLYSKSRRSTTRDPTTKKNHHLDLLNANNVVFFFGFVIVRSPV
jgi:hypothetical protein